MAAHKGEYLRGHEAPRLKILLCHSGAHIVVVGLRKSSGNHIVFQVGQHGLEILNGAGVKILAGRDGVNASLVNVFQRGHALRGGFAVALDTGDGPGDRVPLNAQLANLSKHLLPLFDEDVLHQLQVFFFQDPLNLLQTHAQLLHILDQVETGILADVIITVGSFRVSISGMQQPQLIVQPQGRNGGMVHFGHLPDGKQLVLHDVFLRNSHPAKEFSRKKPLLQPGGDCGV